MSTDGRHPNKRLLRLTEALVLAVVLNASLAASALLANTLSGSLPGTTVTAQPDFVIIAPLSLVAACLGLAIASRLDLAGRGFVSAVNKAAIVSLCFVALTAAFGVSRALMGAAIGLPVLFAATWLLARLSPQATSPARSRGARLPVVAYVVAVASLLGFTAGPMATSASAAPVAAHASTASAGGSSNPCSSAPHDTFNVSAINVDITLNKYGVHDPNSFMYVLTSQIPAVRAEEAARTVSTGLDGDPIQPLVLRAHEGDCVTVNLTNSTTFGVQAMDQGPAPDPADGCNNGQDANGNNNPPVNVNGQCDGALAQTAPGNIAWNVDGLPGLTANDVSSGVGKNSDNTAAPGKTVSYTVYMDPALGEGAHRFHTTGDTRQLDAHGLFGALVSEPVGSQWLDPHTLQPLASGWDAVIKMPSGPSFREFTLIFHEIGDEGYRQIMEKPGTTCDTADGEVNNTTPGEIDGCELPVVDPFTEAYRPCSKAINYRSECFFERLLAQKKAGFTPDDSQSYGSYMNGDMATPQPQLYIGDPYKIRLINAGSEMAHVFHEHGGGIRWLRNPNADNPDIAGGLEKFPPVTKKSVRVDSQTIQPGESYDLETECGGGGCQQAAGDFLYHCHIAEHYIAGMVGFIRAFDTQQPNLATVPGRTARPAAVTSAGLLGKTIGGKTVVLQSQLTSPSTQVALESLVQNQLPPQGVRANPQDATVWDWVKGGTASAPVYLGEPEDTHVWPDYTAPHPGQRDPIMFDPSNGRYAWPLFQPHLGMRPPFSPNGHSGAPWLGPTTSSTRPDGLCPAGAPVRTYNITAIQVKITETNGGLNPPQVDNNGQIFVLNEDKAAVEAGTKPANPLVIRSDVGDCIALTLTSELAETAENHNFSKVNMHTHFVQFDPQASDGVITGFSFEQSVKPDTGQFGETTLTAAAAAGATQISVASTTGLRPGIGIEVGQGMPDTEVATQITAISGNTLTLNAPLQNAHASGERTGVEFVQYRWYSDVDDGTVFFHDHVDGIHSWGHGLFAAHIIEPKGSSFHDPVTGAPIRSGPIADIYTTGSAGFGEQGDFREFVLFEHTGLTSSGSPQGCEMSSFNMRAAPLIDRDPNANTGPGPEGGSSVPAGAGNYTTGFTALEEPAGPDRVDCTNIGVSNDPYVFSSVVHGDPATPVLRAYTGDPVVIRQVGLDERVGDIRITGHRFAVERFNPNGVLTDSATAGISEKMDYILDGGAGGPEHLPGDYLYYSGRNLEMESGAWGIFRVMDKLHSSGTDALEALPDRTAPPAGAGFPTLTFTGKAPPAAPNGPDTSICPQSAPLRHYDVSVFNGITFDNGQPGQLPIPGNGNNNTMMYSLTSDEAAIKAGTKPTVPLAIRANAGDCLTITLKNDLPVDNFTWTWGAGTTQAGLNIGNVIYNPQASYGGAIGYDPSSSVAPGGTRTYTYYVDKQLGTNLMLNMANESSWRMGAYGALIAEPQGSVYADPYTGAQLQSGIFADIFPGDGTSPFRENVDLYSDREPLTGHSIMVYYLDDDHSYTDYNEQSLTQEEGTALNQVNLWQAKSDAAVAVGNGSATPVDPATPLFEAYAGDPVVWRVASAAGDNAMAFQVAGSSFPLDHGLSGSQIIEARTLMPGETFDAYIVNGAGGATGATGDFEYNVGRNPMIKSGNWGIFRVLPLFGPAGVSGQGHILTKL